MWIRDEFFMSDEGLDKVIVHGHTPIAQPVHRFNRIGVDTGAYATGCLTAAILQANDCQLLAAKVESGDQS